MPIDGDSVRRALRRRPRKRKRNETVCTFCGKAKDEVQKLIAGPSVFICNECVVLCVRVLRESGIDVPRE
jgi:hypothetical protein